MFESAGLPHAIDKPTYKAAEPKLREELLAAQLELVQQQSFPLIVVIAGLDAAGKGEAIHKLYEWLDPRHLRTLAYGAPSDAERTRPPMWRFWRDLPPKGKIGIVFGSWYSAPLRAAVLGQSAPLAFERALEGINRFEQMLADEGALILKLWFHLARGQQKARLERLAGNPGASRHVLEEWTGVAHHKAVVKVAEQMARQTSRAHAPWVVIPSADDRFRDLAMGQTILAALQGRLAEGQSARPPAAPALIAAPDRKTVLDALDLSARVAKASYETRLAALQDRLATLTDARAFRRIGLVLAFEGSDAAGKGGVIRRVTQALDPRRFDAYSIAAPSDEERAQPYLWRFWRNLPRKGNVAVFDRSWYGRVLVERVEGFADEPAWLRAYNEINDFEAQLHEFGLVVIKFWLTISAEEQLHRFKQREATAFKQHKITADDWRNRARWDLYRQAVADMVDRTSTSYAPWTLIEAEDKRHGRLKVLETICTRIEAALGKSARSSAARPRPGRA